MFPPHNKSHVVRSQWKEEDEERKKEERERKEGEKEDEKDEAFPERRAVRHFHS